MNTREAWVDIIKGIGILAIVGSHAGMPEHSGLFGLALCFMVPLFFFSAGYTYKKYGFGEMIRKRIKRLLIPFFVCNMIIVSIDRLIGFSYGWGFGKNSLLSQYKAILTFNIPNGLCAPSWFLICLFVVYLLFWVIHTFLEEHPDMIGLICLLCAVIVLAAFDFSTSVDFAGCKIILNSGMGLFSFGLGWMCRQKQLAVRISVDRSFGGYLFLIAIVLMKIIVGVFDYGFDFRGGNANRAFFSLPVIILGLYAAVYFSVLIAGVHPFSEILQYIGRNSLSIVLWHILSFQIVSVLEINILGMEMDNWPNVYTGNILSSMLLTVVGTAVPALVATGFKRYGKWVDTRKNIL